MEEATRLLVWGLVVHLIADWLLQNEWMAVHKVDLRHPAAWVHSGIHAVGLGLVFTWPAALLIGCSHLLIDTRQPLFWWLRVIKRMPAKSGQLVIEIWVDQVMHIVVLAIAALAVAHI